MNYKSRPLARKVYNGQCIPAFHQNNPSRRTYVDGSIVIEMKALYSDGSVQETEESLKVLRHTASHVMAQAVQRLYPGTKLAIGPAIDDGFYYDFDKEGGFVPEDLEKIEAEMKKIIKENLKLETYTLSRQEAIDYLKSKGEIYKVQLVVDLPQDARISFYKQGEFVDLCAGPHALYTKAVKAFKLTSIAGAYWRGDEKNKMLSRIYGTAWVHSAGKQLADDVDFGKVSG